MANIFQMTIAMNNLLAIRALVLITCMGLMHIVSRPANAANFFRYSVDMSVRRSWQPTVYAKGFLETDGTLGYLSPDSFTDWEITLSQVVPRSHVAVKVLTPENSILDFDSNIAFAHEDKIDLSIKEVNTGFRIQDVESGNFRPGGIFYYNNWLTGNFFMIRPGWDTGAIGHRIKSGRERPTFNFLEAVPVSGGSDSGENQVSVPEPSTVLGVLSVSVLALGLSRRRLG
jgi:hypothetical protein